MRPHRTAAHAAASGFLLILGIMIPLAATGIGIGAFRMPVAESPDIEPWLVFEVVGGAVACALGGALSARLGGHAAAKWLAAAVFVVAVTEGLLVATLGGAPARPWLPFVVPLVGGGSVLAGARLAAAPRPGDRTATPWQLWIAPAAAVALLSASLLAPGRPDVQRAVRAVAVLAELGLVSYVGFAVIRTLRRPVAPEGDALDAIRRVATSVAGNTMAAGIIATELGILYSAFMWRRAPRSVPPGFTHHEELGYGSVAAGFAMVIAIETVVVHLMLQSWSPMAAWVLTGLSLYGVVWILGDYRAMRRRATSLSTGTIAIRLGLRWELDVPLATVVRAELVDDREEATTADLRVSPLRASNVRLDLQAPVRARGMYGIQRNARTIRLQLDQPAAFVAIVRAQRAALERASPTLP